METTDKSLVPLPAANRPSETTATMSEDAVQPGAALPDVDMAAASSDTLAVAPPWKLMWWKFRKNRLALISGVVLILFYLVALFAPFFAPYDPNAYRSDRPFAPPQTIHFTDENGSLTQPFVYGYTQRTEIVNMAPRRIYTEDLTQKYTLGLLVSDAQGGLHLFGTVDPNGYLFLFGADDAGRDLFSRMIFALQISLSIGLLGVSITLGLGILIGGITGYYGGWLDNLTQRAIEFLDAIPKTPLWLGLSAAIPLTWPPISVYIGIVIILALLEWGGPARSVRSRFLTLRDSDFVMAARVAGAKERRIIFRHMLPSFYSHLIASVTLKIPGTILGETGLSFLGLGLKAPLISFGVLLQDAQNIRSLAIAPWLVFPAAVVIILVLAYNFFGDGLRDAADPYTS